MPTWETAKTENNSALASIKNMSDCCSRVPALISWLLAPVVTDTALAAEQSIFLETVSSQRSSSTLLRSAGQDPPLGYRLGSSLLKPGA